MKEFQLSGLVSDLRKIIQQLHQGQYILSVFTTIRSKRKLFGIQRIHEGCNPSCAARTARTRNSQIAEVHTSENENSILYKKNFRQSIKFENNFFTPFAVNQSQIDGKTELEKISIISKITTNFGRESCRIPVMAILIRRKILKLLMLKMPENTLSTDIRFPSIKNYKYLVYGVRFKTRNKNECFSKLWTNKKTLHLTPIQSHPTNNPEDGRNFFDKTEKKPSEKI